MNSPQTYSRPPSVKLRTSCDRCQETKVKCDQEKPECQRCTKKGLKCVYSPLRRFGRPHKGDTAAHRASLERQRARSICPQLPLSPPEVPASRGVQIDALHHEEIYESTESSIPTTPTLDDGRSMFGDVGSTVSTSPRFTREDQGFCQPPSLSGAAPVPSISVGTPWLSSDLQRNHAAKLNSFPSPCTTEYRLESTVPRVSHSSAQIPPNANTNDALETADVGVNQDSDKDCYVAILSRLARLEETLAAESPPGIEVLLKAESDTRALQARLFSCQGHQRRSRDTNEKDGSCLDTLRPVMHVLALLVERVVRMLEDLFRRAAMLSFKLREAQQVYSSMTSRRLERSVRNLLECSYTCPLPEAHRVMKVGEYQVREEVRTQAMRGIWRLRIRKLLSMLADMEERAKEASEFASPSGILLGKDGRNAIVDGATLSLIEDLHRRVESLQGRMDVIEQYH